MGWFETLIAIVVGATTLGSTIFGLITWRKTAHDKLQTAISADYKERVTQLEADKVRLTSDLAERDKRIQALEAEKRLPLERLTKLMVKQHREQMTSTNTLSSSMSSMVTKLGEVVDRISQKESAS